MPVDCDSLQEPGRGLQIAEKCGAAASKDANLQGMMNGRPGCASPLFVPHEMKG
jgi:hypothetical protein